MSEEKQKEFLDLLEKMKFNATKHQAVALIQLAKKPTEMFRELLEILKTVDTDEDFMVRIKEFYTSEYLNM